MQPGFPLQNPEPLSLPRGVQFGQTYVRYRRAPPARAYFPTLFVFIVESRVLRADPPAAPRIARSRAHRKKPLILYPLREQKTANPVNLT